MGFYDDARELFGLGRAEARDLLDSLRDEEDFSPRRDSLYDDDWGPVASEYLGDVIEGFDDYDSEYELDFGWEWGRDDWVDAGEEYEFTIQYEEGD